MRRDGIYHSAFVLQKPNRKLLDYIRKWASTAKRFNSGKKGLTSRRLKFRWPNMPEQCTNLDSVKFSSNTFKVRAEFKQVSVTTVWPQILEQEQAGFNVICLIQAPYLKLCLFFHQ